MNHAQGRITVVQEERFLLVTDRGQALRLGLARNVGMQPEELRRLRDTGVHVRVSYEGAPGLESGTAHSLQVTASPAEPSRGEEPA